MGRSPLRLRGGSGARTQPAQGDHHEPTNRRFGRQVVGRRSTLGHKPRDTGGPVGVAARCPISRIIAKIFAMFAPLNVPVPYLSGSARVLADAVGAPSAQVVDRAPITSPFQSTHQT
jgi:hypothetical protein